MWLLLDFQVIKQCELKGKSIIDAVLDGDAKALEQLYCEHRDPFIRMLIKKYGVTVEEAKELYQDTVVTFYENIVSGKLRTLTSSAKTYLFSIGINKARELLRANSKKNESFPLHMVMDHQETGEKKRLEETIEKLTRHMTQLGNPCKQLLEEFYYHRKKMEEICKSMGYKNADAVKTKKYKCLKRLRALFMSDQLRKV